MHSNSNDKALLCATTFASLARATRCIRRLYNVQNTESPYAIDPTMSKSQSALILIRQIIRATDLHDKQLSRATGLTLPQLLTLQTLQEGGSMTIGKLARELNLAQATVTSLLDRLEKKHFVERHRDSQDKRKVWACLSEAGQQLLLSAPTSLHDLFIDKFEGMEQWEQSMVITALERVAGILNALDIDAAPVLDIGDLARSSGEQEKGV